MKNFVIAGLVVVTFFYLFYKSKTKIKAENQKDVANKFFHFVSKRKMEIFTNYKDPSIWQLEQEVRLLIVEAKKMDLFPLEILQKLARYSYLDLNSQNENQIALNEIIELEKYFFDFLSELK